jgi:hypothetical protein
MVRYSSDFDEAVQKHLEFIQNNIARMAQNAFLLKAWSVTLVAAIIALTAREPSVNFVLIALIPALAFWGLDGFYLGQERLFRRLHEDVVAGNVDPFLMDPSEYEEHVKGWLRSVISRSVLPFHLPVVLAVIGIALILHFTAGGSADSGVETVALLLERAGLHG